MAGALAGTSDPRFQALRTLPRHLAFAAAGLALAIVSGAAASADHLKRLAFVSPVASTTVLSGEAAFWKRLEELGWAEGKNIAFEKHFADGDRNRLPGLMAQALKSRPDVLVTPGTMGALAAKRATHEIPIVGLMADPVGTGLVTSLSRPGGNLTGVSVQNTEELPGKWVDLLRELQPRMNRVAVAIDPAHPAGAKLADQLRRATSRLGIQLVVLEAIDANAFETVVPHARRRAQALIVQPTDQAIHSRARIAALARKHRLPTLFSQSDFVDAGGLMSYGSDLGTLWRRVAEYVDRILNGGKPAELPIEQPVGFDLVINLGAAQGIGVTVPKPLLARANRLVE
jgi:putative ABC transport system substrate-binding protein